MSMLRSALYAIVLLPLAPCVFAVEALLYDDFQKGLAEGWQAFGSGTIAVTEYQGNASLRLTKDAMVAKQVATLDTKRLRIGASFAASGLETGKACIAEASFDDGENWYEVFRLIDGQDDSVSLHSGAESWDLPSETTRVWFRARVQGDDMDDTCWLDNVYVMASPRVRKDAGIPDERVLSRAFLLGNSELVQPVFMHEYRAPAKAAEARTGFSGSLRLVGTDRGGKFRAVHDDWDRVTEIGKPITHLPEFDFEFVSRAGDLLPLQRGVQRREHPYWEIILQPGRVWSEVGDGRWARASLPFSLQERSANCTHNGVLTFLYDGESVSRVAYQITSETCGYFKADLWGVLAAEYGPANLTEKAAAQVTRFDAHRNSRLPVRPLSQLADDYPGIEPLSFGVDDGINPGDMTTHGMVVDGVHYRGDCNTRYGSYPYCESLPMPSYSTAKSILAGIATMRIEKLYPGTVNRAIASVVDECNTKKWRDVTIGNALDMATGNYRSKKPQEDEDSIPHWRFLFWDKHQPKIGFACDYFKRKSQPGTQFVYHTSDTYLLGSALQTTVTERRGQGVDLYRSVLLEPIWNALNLSPLLDETKRTYDATEQMFSGYGLTIEADDILRIAIWLSENNGELNGEPILERRMLDAALQRSEGDRGLATGVANLNYNNGFWAFDAGPSLGCEAPAWIPFMSGVSGITVAMFPNGVIYYYFSDSYVFRWQSAREAAHTIRELCQ